jgi:hypothetical protein
MMRQAEVTARLPFIEGSTVAEQAWNQLTWKAYRLRQAGYPCPPTKPGGPPEPFRAKIAALVAWVKTGQGDESAALHQLLDALYVRAIDNEEVADPPIDERSPLGVLLSAGLAREKLIGHEHIPGPQLAALGGVDRSMVRKLVRSGALKRTPTRPAAGRQMDSPILLADARRWLASQGLPGV